MLIGGSKSSCIKNGQIGSIRLSSRFVQFVTFALLVQELKILINKAFTKSMKSRKDNVKF